MLLVLFWEREGETTPLLSYPLFTGSLSIPAFNTKSALSHTLLSLTLAPSIFLIYFSYTIPLVHSALLLTSESCQSPLPIIPKLSDSADSPTKAPSPGTAYLTKFVILNPLFHFGPPWKPTSLNLRNFSPSLSFYYNQYSRVLMCHMKVQVFVSLVNFVYKCKCALKPLAFECLNVYNLIEGMFEY